MPNTGYEIIIKSISGGGSGGSSGGGNNDVGGGNDKNAGSAQDMGWLGDAFSAYKTITGFAPVAAGIGIGKQLVSWRVGVIGRDTGNSLYQEKINFGLQVAGQALSAGGLIFGGLATGNPLMLLGGVTSAISTSISYMRQAEQFNYERSIENVSRALLMERAGPSFNRSRTEAT